MRNNLEIEKQTNITNKLLPYFIGNEPLANLMVGKLNLTPIQAGLIGLTWGWFISLVYAFISNTLLPRNGFTALLQDYEYIITETGILLLVWGYFVWIVRAPAEVLQNLEETKIINFSEKTLEYTTRAFRKRVFEIIPALTAICVGILYVMSLRVTPLRWLNSSLTFLVLRTILVVIPSVFAGGVIIFRIFVNARVFRIILKDVNLHPLHPDRAGGLYSLGHYALTTTYLIAIAGCLGAILEYGAYVGNFLGTAYFAHIVMVLYVFIAPLSFFVPLSAAHDAMRRAKDRLILQIARQFNQDFLVATENLSVPTNNLKNSVDKVQQLRDLSSIAETFPVWPFDLGTIRRFVIAIGSPIITIAISILIDYIKGILIK